MGRCFEERNSCERRSGHERMLGGETDSVDEKMPIVAEKKCQSQHGDAHRPYLGRGVV